MSTPELNSEKLRFTFVKLSDAERKSNISFIRKVKPDYMLEITGLNISCECISEHVSNSEIIQFPESLDCSFFLNYGDLFLCAANCIDQRNFLDTCVSSLFFEALEKRKVCDEIVFRALEEPNRKDEFTSKLLEANNDYAQCFSALSFSAFVALVLIEDEKMDGFFRAAVQNLLTSSNPIEYGALSASQLQSNLNNRNLFSEITMTIRYRGDGTEEYTFGKLFDLIGFEIHQLKGKRCCVKECENCGRLFVPASRVDEKYCNFLFDGFKSCKQVSFFSRLDKDETLKTYRKIYKTQHARKQRNAHRIGIEKRFDIWADHAKKRLEECQSGEITLAQMIEDISSSSWISEN